MNSGASARERELLLTCELASVRTGRHFVRDTLLEWNLARLVEDAELGVSELVANAVRYAKTEVLIQLSAGSQVTIAVVDRDPVLHRPVRPAQDDLLAESGRGLRIVAAVADDWHRGADRRQVRLVQPGPAGPGDGGCRPPLDQPVLDPG
jgi:anti-sigma regulatory factor (Ser/Thr protein kinase)